MKRYDKYKDSGVDRIGEIPEHWEVNKFKSILTVHGRIGFRGYTVSDLVDKGEGAITISPSNMEEGKLNLKSSSYLSWDKYYESPEIMVKEGDFLLVKTASIGKLAYVKKLTEKATVNPQILILKNVKICRPFFFYHLLSSVTQKQLNTEKIGSTIFTISEQKIKNFSTILPPLSEQQAIASFLDDKTSKIDQTISIKEKEIELLKERRQILIQKAVTKGLDDNVPLKDSGVEWIGAIPEHWEMKKLKYIVNMQSGETITAESFTDEGYPVMGGNGFRGFTNKYTNEGDFILIGRQGALCGNVNYAQGKFFATEHAIVVYPNKDVLNILWLGELIRLADLNKLSQTAAQPGISVSQIKNVTIPFIPTNEQQSIVIYLEKIEEKIAKAISIKEQEIEKLKEYKTVLIDDVVTGKVKIN